MKTLRSKILRSLCIPVIVFVIVLLIVNFLYVDYQLRVLTYSYVDSIAREADHKLTVKVKEIEELTKVLAVYLQQDKTVDEVSVRKLLDKLLDNNEEYNIFIVRKPLVIEGSVRGGYQSTLHQHSFSDADESRYLHYLNHAEGSNIWGHIQSEEEGWKTSYIVPFDATPEIGEGVVVADVLLYDLVENLFDIRSSKNVEIVLTVQQEGGEPRTLLLDTQTSGEMKLSVLDLSDNIDLHRTVSDMRPALSFATDTARINDPLDGEGHTYTSRLPTSFGPDMQLMALLPQEEMFQYIYRAKFIEAITALVAFLGLILLIMLISKSISRPIFELTKKVEVLAAGSLNVRFPETESCVELNSLSKNLNQTVRQLTNYFFDLKRVTVQNEKINSEINLSHNVQMSLLPHHKKQIEISGIDLRAYTLPAKKVGGDFYYFFKTDDNRIALVIGDVSGKGMPAAIMMAVCLSLFKAQSVNTPEPGVCLQKINQLLMQEGTDRCTFVTLFYALINPSDGKLIYANAGHNPPLIIAQNGDAKFLDKEHGVALAAMEDVRYRSREEKLNHGDAILLYTDGITEAYNIKEEEFGEQRLIECLNRRKEIPDTRCAKNYVQDIVEHVAQFGRGRVQFDDMTLLCAVLRESEYNPAQHSKFNSSFDDAEGSAVEKHNTTYKHRIAIRHEIQEISRIVQLIESFGRDYHITDEITVDLCVAVDEFVSNIIRHGKADVASPTIELRIARQKNRLQIVIEYSGEAFDPSQPPTLDVREDWQTRRPGGLGIYIGQQLVDHISYTHSAGNNILTIEKDCAMNAQKL